MWEVFGFPEKYRVNKKLGKERYIKHGNLTEAETRRLGVFMDNIQILYAIPFSDGSEMIVLSSEIELPDSYGRKSWSYFLTNYTRAIAQSFPYHCLLAIKCQGVVKVYIFDERKNKLDENRTYVENFYATYDIQLINMDYFSRHFFQRLRECIPMANTAQVLHDLWRNEIFAVTGQPSHAENNAQDNTFAFSIGESRDYISRQKVFEAAMDLSDDYLPEEDLEDDDDDDRYIHYGSAQPWDDQDEMYAAYGDVEDEDDWERVESHFYTRPKDNLMKGTVFEGFALSYDGEAEEAEFIDFCADYCHSLFLEACEENDYRKIEPAEWLKDYCEACSDYAKNAFGKVLNARCIRIISEAFAEKREPSADVYYSFDIGALKEYLGLYFW